jgi:hypothetical protein
MAGRRGPFRLVIHVMPTSPRKGTVMPERQPPRVSDDSPIGPDVDFERDDIRLTDGTRLTPDIAAGIAGDVRWEAGRASLTDRAGGLYPVYPRDGDQVPFDLVQHPLRADAQPAVGAAEERAGGAGSSAKASTARLTTIIPA